MSLQCRTIAVTGADGFIGAVLVAALRDAGAAVRAVSGPVHARSRPLPPDVRHRRADIADLAAMREALRGADTVVHLAGPPSVAHSLREPLEHARAHVMGTATVLEACRELGIAHLVYLSSAEVYGGTQGRDRTAEEQPPAPRSPYGACKAAAEQLVGAAAAHAGMRTVILRPFSIYGPGMHPESLVRTLVGQLAHGVALNVRDWRPVRDFCHVDDLARAVLGACEANVATPLVLNVGTGEGTSVRLLAETLMAVAGRQLMLLEQVAGRRPRHSEILHLVADTRRIRGVLGWAPRISLYDGLARLVCAPDGLQPGRARLHGVADGRTP